MLMFLLTVAPIRRGIPVAELSYISKEAPQLGVVILVPLRKKEVPAIVIAVSPVRDAKAMIKGADFALRKIDQIKILNRFSPSFISAAKSISNWSISTLGSTIQAIFPTILLEDETDHVFEIEDEKPLQAADEGGETPIYLPSVLQAEEVERMAIYKSHIREVFAKNGSVFFILPTIQDIERVDAAIGKGIGSYTYILHSNLTKKQAKDRLREIKESEHPTLVIATPQFLAVPCKNLQSIILERESASSYTMTHKPYIDLRNFVESYARERRIPLLLGDLFLRVETLTRLQKGELDSFTRPKARYSTTAETHLVDMRESGEQPGIGRVAFFSKKLVSLISETRKRGASTFILCIRRGVAPMTVCADCGTVVECSNCKAPLILHRKSVKKVEEAVIEEQEENTLNVKAEQTEGTETPLLDEDSALGVTLPGIGFQSGPTKNIPVYENVFICHRCGEKSEPKHKCENCNSWKLTMLGLGIGQAEDILKSRFPDAPIFRIDTDSITKHKEAKDRAEAFLTTPGAIMLGTEMALPYITEHVGLVAVLSVNSLLTIPDFRMSEHVFRLLLVLREKAREHFLIQTREVSPIFSLALKGNIGEFLEEELSLRKELHFPPYSIFIKVTFEGNKYKGQEFMSEFNLKLSDMGIPTVNYPQYITRKGINVLMSALISLPRKSWPHAELAAYLSSLPPNISVRVDPKSILGE